MHVNISCAPFLPGTFSSSYLHPGRRSHQLSRSKLGEDAKQEAVTPDDRTATTQREIGKKIEDQIKTPMCPIHSPVPEKKKLCRFREPAARTRTRTNIHLRGRSTDLVRNKSYHPRSPNRSILRRHAAYIKRGQTPPPHLISSHLISL
jgi:hypothetical protein